MRTNVKLRLTNCLKGKASYVLSCSGKWQTELNQTEVDIHVSNYYRTTPPLVVRILVIFDTKRQDKSKDFFSVVDCG